MVESTEQEFDPSIDTPPEYTRRLERKKTARMEAEKKFLEGARKIFDDADTDKSTFLSLDQARVLAQGMHSQHGTEFNEEQFQAYFKETDLNGDGKLSWEEWSAKALEQARDGDYFDSDEEADEWDSSD